MKSPAVRRLSNPACTLMVGVAGACVASASWLPNNIPGVAGAGASSTGLTGAGVVGALSWISTVASAGAVVCAAGRRILWRAGVGASLDASPISSTFAGRARVLRCTRGVITDPEEAVVVVFDSRTKMFCIA